MLDKLCNENVMIAALFLKSTEQTCRNDMIDLSLY